MSFKFHGAAPTDWDAEVFHYELRFTEPPRESQLSRLGALYAKWFARGPSDPGGWLFSDRFAYFAVGAKADARDTFAQVAGFLGVAHQIARLDEVVHTTANDALPPLDPGPLFEPSARPPDPGLPLPEPSAVFEAALKRKQDAARLARLEALIAGVKPKEPKLRLVAVPPPLTTPAEHLPEVRARFEGAVGELSGPVGRPSRDVYVGGAFDAVTSFSTADQTLRPPAGLVIRPARVAVFPDGTRALVPAAPERYPGDPNGGKQGQRVLEADLVAGAVRYVWDCEPDPAGFVDKAGSIEDLAYLDPGYAAVLQASRLTIIALPADGIGETVAQTRVGRAYRVHVFHGGELLMVATSQGVRLFAWRGGKLRALATYAHPGLSFHGESDGDIVLHQRDSEVDSPDDFFLAIVAPKASLDVRGRGGVNPP
jgi:hypothetical protein